MSGPTTLTFTKNSFLIIWQFERNTLIQIVYKLRSCQDDPHLDISSKLLSIKLQIIMFTVDINFGSGFCLLLLINHAVTSGYVCFQVP